MALRLEVLDPPALAVFEALRQLPIWSEFYLAGGTGLALQIGHRVSVDFDLFSARDPWDRSGLSALQQRLAACGPVEVVGEAVGTLKLAVRGVPVSFFSYDPPLLEPPVPEGGIALASRLDIGVMKLAAVVGRGGKKDFVDLYALAQEGLALETILEASARKFPQARDFAMQALRALAYFDDADPEPMPRMLRPVAWEGVKRFIADEVSRISRRWRIA